MKIDQDPNYKLTHFDAGKFDEQSDYGGESVFDIEGKDDLPPDMSKQDLRKFQYGVIRKF